MALIVLASAIFTLADFQFTENTGKPLFKKVLATSLKYDNADRLMFVVGATKASYLKEIRSIVPNAFLLIPWALHQALHFFG